MHFEIGHCTHGLTQVRHDLTCERVPPVLMDWHERTLVTHMYSLQPQEITSVQPRAHEMGLA
jgi:hypothetical protein